MNLTMLKLLILVSLFGGAMGKLCPQSEQKNAGPIRKLGFCPTTKSCLWVTLTDAEENVHVFRTCQEKVPALAMKISQLTITEDDMACNGEITDGKRKLQYCCEGKCLSVSSGAGPTKEIAHCLGAAVLVGLAAFARFLLH